MFGCSGTAGAGRLGSRQCGDSVSVRVRPANPPGDVPCARAGVAGAAGIMTLSGEGIASEPLHRDCLQACCFDLARRRRPIESRVEFKAGPAANNLGPRAVLRRHALRAARQRTLEANGIDRGAVLYLSGRTTPRAASRLVERDARWQCHNTSAAATQRLAGRLSRPARFQVDHQPAVVPPKEAGVPRLTSLRPATAAWSGGGRLRD